MFRREFVDNANLGRVWAPRALGVLRIASALLLLQHATTKLFRFPYVEMFADMPVLSLYGLAGVIELVGGILLLLGLFVRPVAFILSGQLAVAYFIAHAPMSFFPLLNQGELAALYSFVFLYLAAAGGGRWALDERRGASAH